MQRIIIILLTLLTLCAQDVVAEYHTPDYYDSTVRDHFKNQRWAVGKKILDEAMKEYGHLSVINELQGWYYYHFKKYTQARYFLYKSLRDDNDNQHARELLVSVEEETKNYSSAICYINEILETNPYALGWWRRKINIYRKQGNNYEADRLLQRLKQIYPKETQVQKDISYQTEMILNTQKKANDTEGMIQSLKSLIRTYPKNAERYLQLSNLLLQLGRTNEALEIAAQGARATGNTTLMKKYAGILADQGRYAEAIAYLKEMQRTMRASGLDAHIKDMEDQMAQASLNNDPYIVYGKLYEKKNDLDALQFLLNTSMARGFDDDALYYISEMRKRKGNSFKLTYMEYSVYKRTGNIKAANRTLEKLAQMNPNDEDVNEDIVALHMDKANTAMQTGSYDDAIPELLFVQSRTKDAEIKKSCAQRLFNCYLQTKDYERATLQLDSIKSNFSNERYVLSKVDILRQQGKDYEALNLLSEAYHETDSADEKIAYSETYEEIVYPKIKELIELKLMRPANKLAMSAIEICPNSQLLYHQAITTSDLIKKTKEHRELIAQARKRFPDDPYFIVKEAGLYSDEGDYDKAREMIRPLLDVYIGDTAMIKAYVSNCELAAQKRHKEKNYEQALKDCDDGLAYLENNRELLYTKGLIFEDMKMYDSAYFYQRKYIPSIMEVSEFKGHLESLCAKMLRNTLTFDYNHSVNGENNKRTGIANAVYTRKWKRDSFDFSLAYSGKDGNKDKTDDVEAQEPGGTGVQIGAGWTHQTKGNLAWTVSGSGATKYFPIAKLSLSLDINDITLGKKISFNLHPRASIRWIRTYQKLFRSVYDPDHIPQEDKGEAFDAMYYSAFFGWKGKKDLLYTAGLSLSKDIDRFHLTAGGDLYYMSKHIFYSISAKGTFSPFDHTPSNVYVMGGLGSAPEASLLDKSMPGSFDHTNTYIGMGGMYMCNRYMSLGFSGTWYTLYDTNQVLKDAGKYYSRPKAEFVVLNKTKFTNYFYLNAQLLINF